MNQTVLLALDTSTEFCSVALLSAPAAPDAGIGADVDTTAPAEPRVWFRHEPTGAVSSTRLLPAIRELVAEAGLTLSDCAAIAFGAGPGSFTGLRTATGVAQGLAFGLNLPVVPVGTLLACAESARRRDASVTRVLAALDARMDEVYWADFAWDTEQQAWRTLRAAALDAPQDVVLPDEPFTLAGNAAAAFGERLPAVAAARTVDYDALPHAVPLAHAALRAFRAGRTVPADQAAPEYVRNKVAQTTAERMAEKAAKAGGADRAEGAGSTGIPASARHTGTAGQTDRTGTAAQNAPGIDAAPHAEGPQ
jgi:tRNA threonylcarbamoyladenosine biosynthesis protein TsaB